MAGTMTVWLSEAAQAVGIDHWVQQSAVRFMAHHGDAVNAHQLAQGVGASRSLINRHVTEHLTNLKLIRFAGKTGNFHNFALTPDGEALAEQMTEELGPYVPHSGTRRPYAPGKPKPGPAPVEVVEKAATNGHAKPGGVGAMFDSMTLAEIRALAEGSDEAERSALKALVLRRAGLA